MVSYGKHPGSDEHVGAGYEKYAMNTLDIQADIGGVMWPLRSIKWDKTFKIDPEHGTGSHDPGALVNAEHGYVASFTYASFLVNGTPAMVTKDVLALGSLLTDAMNEGRAKYFDIYIMEVPSNSAENPDAATEAQAFTKAGSIEVLMDNKVTKITRDYPHNGTIVTSVDTIFRKKLPA
jgi:hypothetical protein